MSSREPRARGRARPDLLSTVERRRAWACKRRGWRPVAEDPFSTQAFLLLLHLKTARFGRIGMEQLWNRGGAIGGKGSAHRTSKNGLNYAKPLPPAATGCRLDRMVRRGSPVRVRKRALMKAPHTRGFCFPDALHFVQCARVWNRFWNNQTKGTSILLSSQASERRPRPIRLSALNLDAASQRPGSTGQSSGVTERLLTLAAARRDCDRKRPLGRGWYCGNAYRRLGGL
jgi:hypothetical protein